MSGACSLLCVLTYVVSWSICSVFSSTRRSSEEAPVFVAGLRSLEKKMMMSCGDSEVDVEGGWMI